MPKKRTQIRRKIKTEEKIRKTKGRKSTNEI